ncbi:MAG TPA: methyltransferase domain-containing protein, partial [Acidobacteriaceae bacterium]|nr:methyltransferase domain-containing protein [Acidobacteriaceae bacterium]
AVITWTLCSIPDPAKALKQIRRVLKADGRLIFIEHGRASDPSVVAWQDRMTPLWRHIAGGCRLNQKTDDLLTAAGFRITEMKTGYIRGPHPITYTYQGVAEKSAAETAV